MINASRFFFNSTHIYKAHAVAGLQQGWQVTRQVPHGFIGHADDLPAARTGLWIDGAERTRQCHSARRHLGARRGAARYVEDRVPAAQIGKARCKAGKGHRPFTAGVAAHDFFRADAQNLRHLGKIFTVVTDGNLHQHIGALHFAIQIASCNAIDELRRADDMGGELYKNGACGRHQLLHAFNGLCLQRPQQCQRLLQIGQLHQNALAIDGKKTHGAHYAAPTKEAICTPSCSKR